MRRLFVLSFGIVLLARPHASAQFGGGGSGGIHIDPQGVIRELERRVRSPKGNEGPTDKLLATPSDARHISLKRLDQALQSALASGNPIPLEIQFLAGLVKIDTVYVDRQNEDVVLIGPAEGWRMDEGRPVGKTTKRATLHLEDLANAMRCVFRGSGEVRCSIDPTRSGLAALRDVPFPAEVTPKSAADYRDDVAATFGLQIVSTAGVPEGSRFALTMVEADYRMKRMALGREKLPGVVSHLDTLTRLTREDAHRGSLARWWFAPAYDEILSDPGKTTFRFVGQGIQLLNEEVLFDASGQRTGLGRSNPDWDRFSDTFTAKLPEIEKQHPVFADLHNLFDLMMVAGLLRQQGIQDWFEETALLDSSLYTPPTFKQPTKAEPVVTTRLDRGRKEGQSLRFLTIAYGGVTMNPMAVLAESAMPESALPEAEKKEVGDDPKKSDDNRDQDNEKKSIEVESPFTEAIAANTWWADGK